MKRHVIMILATLSLSVMLAGLSVHAQSDMRLKANIPFEFSVGNKVLPAGEYTVTYISHGVALIRSEDSTEFKSFFFTIPTEGARGHESSLVFHRYGDQYFLSTIWTAGDSTGHELSQARAERELIRATRVLAERASERQTVSIIAHR